MAGFLLALIFDLAVLDPALHLMITRPAQSQGELAMLAYARFVVILVGIIIAAALRAGFPASLLQVRLRLGLAWLVASVTATATAFLLVAALVGVLSRQSPIVTTNLDGVPLLSLVPGLLAGVAGWLVLRRLPRAPLLLVAFTVAAVAATVVEIEIARLMAGAPFSQTLVAETLAAGLVIGLGQGVALAWILGEEPAS